jgi:hypothetical protein
MASKKTSPQEGSKGACLCEDGTYSKECCKGEEINQGIGALVGQGTSLIINTNEPRTVGSGS